MQKLKVFLALTRPVNVLIGMLSIFIGAFITGTIHPVIKVLLACFSGGLITGGANAINDYFDLEIDRINKPHRPLPLGRLSPKEARVFSIMLLGSGVIIAAVVNFLALLIACFAASLLYFYSAILKRTVLWGNLSVSLVTALAFIYGGVAVHRFRASLIPAGFSFFFHLGREIIKDVEDHAGDVAQGAVTLPIRFGVKVALGVTTVVFMILILATLIPFFLKIYGWVYLLVVIVGVDLVLVFTTLSMWKNPTPGNLGRLSTILKADMLVGLLAIYVGRWP